MLTVNIHEAKTHLSKLVDHAVKGEAFVIAKAGKPLVKVMALETPAAGQSDAWASWPARSPCPTISTGWASAEIAALFGSGGVKLLLDTHLLLWAAGEPERFPAAARKPAR